MNTFVDIVCGGGESPLNWIIFGGDSCSQMTF